jgi:hypothetical protein
VTGVQTCALPIYRVDCKVCGTVAELLASCPLCGAAGPLRERPDDD